MATRLICFLLLQYCICEAISYTPTVKQYVRVTGVPSALTMAVPTSQTIAPKIAVTSQARTANVLPPLSSLDLANLVTSLQGNLALAPNQMTSQVRPASAVSPYGVLGIPDLVSSLQRLPVIQQSVPTSLATQGGSLSATPAVSPLGLPNIVSSLPAFQQPVPTNVATQSRPLTGTIPASNLALSNLVPTPKPVGVISASPNIDSNLLNNLAIAVQLLAINNILNSPPPSEGFPRANTMELPCSEPNSGPFSQSMPNSKFVGSSNFGEPSLLQGSKPSRGGASLMSPYEALGSNPSYSESMLSQYASPNPRQDFQSPYAMLMDKVL